MKKIRRRFLPGNWRLRIGRSRTGLGMYAMEDMPRAACVIEYIGKPVPYEEQDDHNGMYLFETGRKLMIDGNIKANIARRINHSCAPNCEADIKDHRVYIFTIRKIKAGEELTYDYGKEFFDEHIKPKGCQCTKCRKKRTIDRKKKAA